MARIRTFTLRRLKHLRRRAQKVRSAPTVLRSTLPFRFDACLRIAGIGEHHEELAAHTGIVPTRSHKKGEVRSRRRDIQWAEDLWLLESPLGEHASLDEHLIWLAQTVAPHKEYFGSLIAKASWADICLGCLSESAYPVLSAEPSSLALIRELPLALSFNFTCV
jgi:hypothetical protein